MLEINKYFEMNEDDFTKVVNEYIVECEVDEPFEEDEFSGKYDAVAVRDFIEWYNEAYEHAMSPQATASIMSLDMAVRCGEKGEDLDPNDPEMLAEFAMFAENLQDLVDEDTRTVLPGYEAIYQDAMNRFEEGGKHCGLNTKSLTDISLDAIELNNDAALVNESAIEVANTQRSMEPSKFDYLLDAEKETNNIEYNN